jgi:hypothetical protein
VGRSTAVPPKTPQHQSDPRSKPARGLVDDKNVAGGASENVLGDASLDQSLEESLLASADDEKIDSSLLSEAEDCFGWRAD